MARKCHRTIPLLWLRDTAIGAILRVFLELREGWHVFGNRDVRLEYCRICSLGCAWLPFLEEEVASPLPGDGVLSHDARGIHAHIARASLCSFTALGTGLLPRVLHSLLGGIYRQRRGSLFCLHGGFPLCPFGIFRPYEVWSGDFPLGGSRLSDRDLLLNFFRAPGPDASARYSLCADAFGRSEERRV